RPATQRRLTWSEQRELDGMEATILEAEAELEKLGEAAADPDVATRADVLAERWRAVETARARVDSLYERWSQLEAKRDA
ncbi:ABC transporter ATP-binding protein, partial [bacterium]|nr:ABC transporter ATP-binding protein [bacterium]